jgi:hypothetical protein
MLKRTLFLMVYLALSHSFIAQPVPVKNLSPNMTFGGVDVPKEVMIGSIKDFIITDKEQIVIADDKMHELVFYSIEGEFIKRVGQKGNGPGDFDNPVSVFRIRDSLVVWEERNNRFQYLSIDGDFVKLYTPKLHLSMKNKCFDDEWNLYYATNGFRNNKLLGKTKLGSGKVEYFGEIEGESFDLYRMKELKKKLLDHKIPNSFKNHLEICDTKDEKIITVHKYLPLLKKFDCDGNKIFDVELESELFEEIYKKGFEKNKDIPKLGMVIPKLISDVTPDGSGGVFLLINHKNFRVQHFDKNGKLLEILKAPARSISNIFFHKGQLWGASSETLQIFSFTIE